MFIYCHCSQWYSRALSINKRIVIDMFYYQFGQAIKAIQHQLNIHNQRPPSYRFDVVAQTLKLYRLHFSNFQSKHAMFVHVL